MRLRQRTWVNEPVNCNLPSCLLLQVIEPTQPYHRKLILIWWQLPGSIRKNEHGTIMLTHSLLYRSRRLWEKIEPNQSTRHDFNLRPEIRTRLLWVKIRPPSGLHGKSRQTWPNCGFVRTITGVQDNYVQSEMFDWLLDGRRYEVLVSGAGRQLGGCWKANSNPKLFAISKGISTWTKKYIDRTKLTWEAYVLNTLYLNTVLDDSNYGWWVWQWIYR